MLKKRKNKKVNFISTKSQSSLAVLAVDAGTSSFRTALYDASGRMIQGSLAREFYPLLTDHHGKAVIEPLLILKAFENALQKTLRFASQKKGIRIEAAGISFFWHSLVGLSKAGKPITPVLTWADGRCRGEAEKLRQKIDEKKYHQSTGCMIRSAYWFSKLKWHQKSFPQIHRQVAQWISPAELILKQMTGQVVLSHSMAAGTGLYDQQRAAWSSVWSRAAGVSPSKLPPISNEGFLTLPVIAKRYPLLKSVHWFAGVGDGAASNLGLGATDGKTTAINFGTSAAIRVLTKMSAKSTKTIPFGLFCYRLDAERLLVGGAITNAGIVRAWFDREYQAPKVNEISKSVLWSLPFLAPERAPSWCEELPGMTVGFRLETKKVDHYQSMMDATFYRLNQIRDRLRKWSGRSLTYRLGGGIADAASVVQRMSDVFGERISIVEESEASIRGAAIYALTQLGEEPSSPREIKTYRPQLTLSRIHHKRTQQLQVIEEEYRKFYNQCAKRGVLL